MVNVSVIIPVYNVETYLRQCLDSVVNQTLRDIEIICVDDGSTDGSAAILREYADKDSRVRVLLHEHTNAGDARNAGMAVATGEYLGFVDSDDWCELTLFEKAYAKAKTENADVVTWLFTTYNEAIGRCGVARVFESKMNPFAPVAYAPWQRIIRRSFVVEQKISFQSIERSNDVYFCCMSLVLAQKQVQLPEVLYFYRTGTGVNLQANNAKTPMLIIQAWLFLAKELMERNLFAKFQEQFCNAATNSIFYTLHSITSVKPFVRFYDAIRDLYLNDPIFSGITEATVTNRNNRHILQMLRGCKMPLTFLLRNTNYWRERLSDLYWERKGFERKADALTQNLAESQRARRINWEDAQRLQKELDASDERVRAAGAKSVELEKLLAESQRARRINWEDAQRLQKELDASNERVRAAGAKSVELEKLLVESQRVRQINWEDAQRLQKELDASNERVHAAEAKGVKLEKLLAESQRARRINWEEAQRLQKELDASNERVRAAEAKDVKLEKLLAESQRARRINWEEAQRLQRELDASDERFRAAEAKGVELEQLLTESQRARRINWEEAQRLQKELNSYQSLRLCRWIRSVENFARKEK